ncbi:hypothetical protein BGW38_005765, partial [Lunasporangiospora selenospora]
MSAGQDKVRVPCAGLCKFGDRTLTVHCDDNGVACDSEQTVGDRRHIAKVKWAESMSRAKGEQKWDVTTVNVDYGVDSQHTCCGECGVPGGNDWDGLEATGVVKVVGNTTRESRPRGSHETVVSYLVGQWQKTEKMATALRNRTVECNKRAGTQLDFCLLCYVIGAKCGVDKCAITVSKRNTCPCTESSPHVGHTPRSTITFDKVGPLQREETVRAIKAKLDEHTRLKTTAIAPLQIALQNLQRVESATAHCEWEADAGKPAVVGACAEVLSSVNIECGCALHAKLAAAVDVHLTPDWQKIVAIYACLLDGDPGDTPVRPLVGHKCMEKKAVQFVDKQVVARFKDEVEKGGGYMTTLLPYVTCSFDQVPQYAIDDPAGDRSAAHAAILSTVVDATGLVADLDVPASVWQLNCTSTARGMRAAYGQEVGRHLFAAKEFFGYTRDWSRTHAGNRRVNALAMTLDSGWVDMFHGPCDGDEMLAIVWQRIASDFTDLCQDIAEGEPNNLVALCLAHGETPEDIWSAVVKSCESVFDHDAIWSSKRSGTFSFVVWLLWSGRSNIWARLLREVPSSTMKEYGPWKDARYPALSKWT